MRHMATVICTVWCLKGKGQLYGKFSWCSSSQPRESWAHEEITHCSLAFTGMKGKTLSQRHWMVRDGPDSFTPGERMFHNQDGLHDLWSPAQNEKVGSLLKNR